MIFDKNCGLLSYIYTRICLISTVLISIVWRSSWIVSKLIISSLIFLVRKVDSLSSIFFNCQTGHRERSEGGFAERFSWSSMEGHWQLVLTQNIFKFTIATFFVMVWSTEAAKLLQKAVHVCVENFWRWRTIVVVVIVFIRIVVFQKLFRWIFIVVSIDSSVVLGVHSMLTTVGKHIFISILIDDILEQFCVDVIVIRIKV